MGLTEIRLAHSPDSDDAFMFCALATGKLDTGNLHFTHILEDIESLNQKALQGVYEVTAVSIHAYAYIHERYALLSSGASMGDRYGPILVARDALAPEEVHGKSIAVPGLMTSAYLTLRLFQPEFEPVVIPFDQIISAVLRGQTDAGLLIHEGQLTYAQQGLHKIVDLGEWWYESTGLPLPLGGNAIRRDLGNESMTKVAHLLKESIQYALEHREEALEYALRYARDLHSAEADRFVGMYVNARTLDYGEEGRRAVALLLDRAHEARIIPSRVTVEFFS